MNICFKNPIGIKYYNQGCKSLGKNEFRISKVPAERHKKIHT